MVVTILILQTTYAVNMMVRCATEIETTMVSAERIHEYSNIPTEVLKENSFFIERMDYTGVNKKYSHLAFFTCDCNVAAK